MGPSTGGPRTARGTRVSDDQTVEQTDDAEVDAEQAPLEAITFEGKPVAAIVTKLSGSLDEVARPIHPGDRGYVLVEWKFGGANHNGDPLKRTQTLDVHGAFEVGQAEAEPLMAAHRAAAVAARDEALGRRSLGAEVDDTVQVTTNADGVVMTAAELAEARGDLLPADRSFAVEFLGGARGVWPEAWLGLGQTLAAVGGTMRLPESTALGEVDQVIRWVDLESGEALAEWTEGDEEARLADLEQALAVAEAKADREVVEAMTRPAPDLADDEADDAGEVADDAEAKRFLGPGDEPEDDPEPSAWVHELSAECWCEPTLVCAECLDSGPCLCGSGERFVIHRLPA